MFNFYTWYNIYEVDDSDDITSGEDDDELNDASNINSAGEEIGDEFESQNESYYQRTDVFVGDDDQIDDDNDRGIKLY